jgi:putative oxidoreductase
MIDLKRWEAHRGIVRVCQVAIGLVFLVAALAKIGDVSAFAADVHNFRLVPIALENLVAISLPWVELVAGLALVVGVRSHAAAAVVAALMVVFTLAVIAALARGLDIECGCFGKAAGTRVGAKKLGENVGLSLLAFAATLRTFRREAL